MSRPSSLWLIFWLAVVVAAAAALLAAAETAKACTPAQMHQLVWAQPKWQGKLANRACNSACALPGIPRHVSVWLSQLSHRRLSRHLSPATTTAPPFFAFRPFYPLFSNTRDPGTRAGSMGSAAGQLWLPLWRHQSLCWTRCTRQPMRHPCCTTCWPSHPGATLSRLRGHQAAPTGPRQQHQHGLDLLHKPGLGLLLKPGLGRLGWWGLVE